MTPRARSPGAGDADAQVAALDADDCRTILSEAAGRHADVASAVRLAAARRSHDLTALRAEIDRGLRSGRFLDYHDSRRWALAAAPIVKEIRHAVATSPTAEVVALIERAIGHVVKVILKGDDSHGLIGDVARGLLDLHAVACDTGVADPVKLARWMIRFRFNDQDFFEVDPVRYADALGEAGLAAYRQELQRRTTAGDADSFAARYAQQRLAVLAGDTAAIVDLYGGDLSAPHQFIKVAQAMAELGRDDDVVSWARRGIAETSGWQLAQLYDLAAVVHLRRAQHDELLRLRRQQHHHMASSSTYRLLRDASQQLGVWETGRPGARSVLAERDLGGLVDVLVDDEEPDAAWQVTLAKPAFDPGQDRWMRLAEVREPSVPGDALQVYLRLADRQLQTTGKAAYSQATATLTKAARAAKAAGRQSEFAEHMAVLRQTQRRRPTLISTLDKARLP